MTAALPRNAELSMVRLHLDQTHMRGFQHFVLIEQPGKKRVRLLHTVHLTVVGMPAAALQRTVRGPIQPRTLLTVLRRRRKDLVAHGRRHAGGLADALIEHLEASTERPRQLDLEDCIAEQSA